MSRADSLWDEGVHQECKMEVSPTSSHGIHSGRRRYRVVCLTCRTLIHEATTGPGSRVDSHLSGRLKGQPLEAT